MHAGPFRHRCCQVTWETGPPRRQDYPRPAGKGLPTGSDRFLEVHRVWASRSFRPTIAISIRPIPVKLQGASSFLRKALLRAIGGKGCTCCDSVSLPGIPIGLSGRPIDGLDLNGYCNTREDGINSIGGRFPGMTRARHLFVANGCLAPLHRRTRRGVGCRGGAHR